jgi:hypothetical protein
MLEILAILVAIGVFVFLMRCHRFMEQCVPLGKDPSGPTPRDFGTPSDAGGAILENGMTI